MNANLPFIFLLLISLTLPIFSQQLVCKKDAFSALRPIPKLKYQCREDLIESDDDVLTQKNRLSAINLYAKSLEKFTFADWWKTSVDDLNLCDFRRKVGILSKEQKYDYKNGNYFFHLLGDNQIRLVIVQDPCYQVGFNGSNMFLLIRKNGQVHAMEIIDGFYTRADFPPFIATAMNGREQIVEIATLSGGLYATITNYYFAINPKTNRAFPKKLFLDDDKKPTNQISSMILLGEPEEYGLPKKSEPLQVIKKGKLAKSFDVFVDTFETFGEDNHKKFVKQTLRWNGKFYH